MTADLPVTPHNADAERGLLASCLIDSTGEVLNDCLAANVRPEYFYDQKNAILFEGMTAYAAKGQHPDELMLVEWLKGCGKLELVGGHPHVYHISGSVSTTVYAKQWLGIVREKFFLRQLIRTAQWTVEQANGNGGADVPELLDNVESAFFQIQNDSLTDDATTTPILVDRVNENITKMLSRKGQISGLSTGLTDLDNITSGLHNSDMIVLGARTSQGKSALAINIAENLVLPRKAEPPSPGLIFSIEMAAEQIMHRLVCGHAKVDMRRLMDGFCDRPTELINSSRLIKSAPIFIESPSSPSIYQIRAKARRYQRKHGIKFVIVDYLQLVRPVGKGQTREQDVAEISRGIKAMAKELNIPVIVLAQLGRGVEKENRRPRLSDLRESSAIEQDADVVLLISRPESDQEEAADATHVKREIIVAKNRNGPIGEIVTLFNRRLCKFENYLGQQH